MKEVVEVKTSELLNILGINRNTFQDWLDRHLVSPSIQKSAKRGEQNIFSLGDVYKIAIFKKLIESGFYRDIASQMAGKMSGTIAETGFGLTRRYAVFFRWKEGEQFWVEFFLIPNLDGLGKLEHVGKFKGEGYDFDNSPPDDIYILNAQKLYVEITTNIRRVKK